MTTASRSTETRLRHVRKRLTTLLPTLRAKAEELAPRPGYLVEPVIETHTWVDPADGEAKYEIVYFVVDGTREEWRAFHRRMSDLFWQLGAKDAELRDLVTFSAVSPAVLDSWRSIHATI